MYGREGAHQLCREWCRRAEYFYQIWLETEEAGFEFNQAHADGYEESVEWLDYMISLPAEDAAFARGMEIRRMAPCLGQLLEQKGA